MPTESKCTRGDKCILLHAAITCGVVLVVIVTYVLHLVSVKHEGDDAFLISRRTLPQTVMKTSDYSMYNISNSYQGVGVAYIAVTPAKLMCNTILVRRGWSLAPARCLSIRSHPGTAEYLPKWKIRYKVDGRYKDKYIKRGVVHPSFSMEESDNNLGLIEHFNYINMPYLKLPTDNVVSELMRRATTINREQLSVIVGWRNYEDISMYRVRLLKQDRCSQLVSLMLKVGARLSPTDCCVQYFPRGHSATQDQGAALLLENKIIGYYSWGDKGGRGFPLIILNIAPFRSWIEDIISL